MYKKEITFTLIVLILLLVFNILYGSNTVRNFELTDYRFTCSSGEQGGPHREICDKVFGFNGTALLISLTLMGASMAVLFKSFKRLLLVFLISSILFIFIVQLLSTQFMMPVYVYNPWEGYGWLGYGWINYKDGQIALFINVVGSLVVASSVYVLKKMV